VTGYLLSTIMAGVVALAPPPAEAAPPGSETEIVEARVEVRPGDTLTALAVRHGVTVDDLRRWNARLRESDLIRAGDRLRVHLPRALAPAEPDEQWVGYYDIKPGDTLGGIARKLDVSVGDLQHWNKLGRSHVIRAGQTLRYVRPGARPPARSIGRPTRGRLLHGVHLGEGRGYRLRFPANAYTIERLKGVLQRCTERTHRRFEGTADILIGDISRPTGGYFPPHQSHRSGRDVDIGYYLVDNEQNITLRRLRAHEVDYEKTWVMLRCFLTEDRLVRVFMDTAMQRGMADYLRRNELLDEERLDRLFEAVGELRREALVRHAPKHDTHMHLRFACDPDESECEEEDGDVVFRL